MTAHRIISVERIPTDWENSEYDVAIVAAGYEARSRHLLDIPVRSKLKAAAAFDGQQVFEFHTNVERFRASGFSVDIVADDKYAAWCLDILRKAPFRTSSLRVLADISSLSRVRLAHLVAAMREARPELNISVDFVYALASFTPPSLQENPNSHVGPVIPEFAGWWTDPDRLLSIIVGLGYEQDKALGAVEYLQAQDVWLFTPESVVGEYTTELQKANDSLLAITKPGQQFVYRVSDPLDCFSRLQSLTQGLKTKNNVVFLPFGPKIFVLSCLLIAAKDEQLAVWRVSAQKADEPVNRFASGNLYGLRVLFRSTHSTEAESQA